MTSFLRSFSPHFGKHGGADGQRIRKIVGAPAEESDKELKTRKTSILPYEDCCTVFTPRHPKTKPRLEDVIEAESALDIDALVAEAAANTERVRIQP